MPPRKLPKSYKNLFGKADALRSSGEASSSAHPDSPPVVDPPTANPPVVNLLAADIIEEEYEHDPDQHEHDPNNTEPSEFIESTFPNPDPHPTPSNDEADPSCPKKRGKNKNIALSKRPQGSKVMLRFNGMDGRPDCENRHHWSRHLGMVVRDPNIVSHRLVRWKDLSAAELDHLWQAVSDPFNTIDVHIDSYRDGAMGHIKQIWDRWRCDLNRDYIRPHEGDKEVIRKNPPPNYDPDDWSYILERRYFIESFRRKSAIACQNRRNVRLKHNAGSKPFTQVKQEMEVELGRPPTYLEVFKKTHTPQPTEENPHPMPLLEVQEKITKMERVIEEDPNISGFDLVEYVLGPQQHGRVTGYGSGVSARDFRGDRRGGNHSQRTTQVLREENEQLRAEVNELRERQITYDATQESMRSQLSESERWAQEALQAQAAAFETSQARMREELEESRRQIALIMSRLPPPPPPPS